MLDLPTIPSLARKVDVSYIYIYIYVTQVHRIDNVNAFISMVWRDISLNVLSNDKFNMVLFNCYNFTIGDGTTILFWHDCWISNGCLKDLFPSLFALYT